MLKEALSRVLTVFGESMVLFAKTLAALFLNP